MPAGIITVPAPSSLAPTGTAASNVHDDATATAATTEPAPEYVNYVDIKLEGVRHLPGDWITAGSPASLGGAAASASTAAGPVAAAAAANAPIPVTASNNSNSSASNHPHASAGVSAAGGGVADESEVAYAYHPFRYEVTLSLPADARKAGQPDGEAATATALSDSLSPPTHASSAAAVVASFTHGRLLQPLPAYTAYVAAAEPPPVAGVDDALPLRDVPASIDREDVMLVAADGQNTAAAPTTGAGGGDGAACTTPSPTVTPAATSPSTAGNATTPAILWVMTEKTENAAAGVAIASAGGASVMAAAGGANASGGGGGGASSGLVAAKRRAKLSTVAASNPSSNSISAASTATAATTMAATAAAAAAPSASAAALAAAAAVPGAPAPPLPDSSEPPPCVVRVPLTAAQEAYIETLLESGAPLELRFRRVLRAGCPAEWEDLNASYYEAVIPVNLQGLSVPGSTQLSTEVPLAPACAYTGTSASLSVVGGGGSAGMMPGVAVLSDGGASEQAAANAAANKKRQQPRKARQTAPALLVDEPDRSAPHPYVTAGTTAAVSLHFQRTLTRLVSDRVRPSVLPAQLIPARPTPTVADAAASDVRTRLRGTLRLIAQRLAVELRDAVANTAETEGSDEAEAGGSGGAANAAWRTQFVSMLQSTGQLAAFKSHLTPLVTELVHERLRLEPNACSADEVARASNELYVQLLDMLHGALRECVMGSSGAGALNRASTAAPLTAASATAGVSVTAPGGASTTLPPPPLGGSGDGSPSMRVQPGGPEDERERLRWRAVEAEVSGDVDLAASFLHSRLATHVGDAASWAALWVDCASHYQRTESLAQAEQCYREAIACDAGCTAALLDYGVWLLAHDRLDEAAVFLHGLVDVAPRHYVGWGCIGLLADLQELAIRVGSPSAAAEQTKWSREHHLALRRAVDCRMNTPSHDGATTPSPSADAEQVYLDVATYLIQLHHRDLANVCLARCRPGMPRVELLYARLFTQGGQYAEALKALDGLPASTTAGADAQRPRQQQQQGSEQEDECVLLRAECVAALGRTEEARKLYKQALCRTSGGASKTTPTATAPPYLSDLAARWSATTKQAVTMGGSSTTATTDTASAEVLLEARATENAGMHLLRCYLQLCNMLLAEGRYRDALGTVTLALQVWPACSVLWLGAGIAYYRAGDVIAAEECLQESNTLNPANARTWVYLALLAVRLQHVGVEEIVQQVTTLHLEDAALWAELGRTLLSTAQYPQLTVVCLRRAVALARAQPPLQPPSTPEPESSLAKKLNTGSALLPSTLYHLAHALMDVQQWGEAERLLSEVAASRASNEVLRGKAEEELSMLRAGP